MKPRRHRIKKFIYRKVEESKRHKLQSERLIKRIDEFLKRVKMPIPDFITMSANLLNYKQWLAEPFIYLNYVGYNPSPDKSQRGFFTLANKLMKPQSEYKELISELKNDKRKAGS